MTCQTSCQTNCMKTHFIQPESAYLDCRPRPAPCGCYSTAVEDGCNLPESARNLDDLRRMVLDLTKKGVHVQFIKENLTFTGEDSPMSNLLLSLLGAVAELERSMIRERQREGIALAKKAGVYKGRKSSLTAEQNRERL